MAQYASKCKNVKMWYVKHLMLYVGFLQHTLYHGHSLYSFHYQYSVRSTLILKIYIYGTGTNTSGIISTLDNAGGIYMVNVINSAGTSIGVSYTNNTNSVTVSTLLTAISSAFTTNGGGWTQVSLVDNILTLSNSSIFARPIVSANASY